MKLSPFISPFAMPIFLFTLSSTDQKEERERERDFNIVSIFSPIRIQIKLFFFKALPQLLQDPNLFEPKIMSLGMWSQGLSDERKQKQTNNGNIWNKIFLTLLTGMQFCAAVWSIKSRIHHINNLCFFGNRHFFPLHLQHLYKILSREYICSYIYISPPIQYTDKAEDPIEF